MFADDGTAPASRSTTKIRVPKGRYLISAQLTRSGAVEEVTQLVAPGLPVNKATTLTLDARTGKPLKLTAPDPRARLTSGSIVYGARGTTRDYDYAESLGLGNNSQYERVYLAQAGPSVPTEDFIAQAGGIWQRGTTSDLYDLVTTRKGGYFNGLTHTFTNHGLAKVVTPIGSTAKGSQAAPGSTWKTHGWPGVYDVVAGSSADYRPAPAKSVIHHVTAGAGLRWDLGMVVITDSSPFLSVFDAALPRRYEPGRTYHETFNTGVFAPVTSASTTVGDTGAVRTHTGYAVCIPLLGDGAGHTDSPEAKTRYHLTSGSTTIADYPIDPCGIPLTGLLAHKATYRLAIDTTRPAGAVTVGTRASAVWTFTSAPTTGAKPVHLPLSVVRFTPKLSLTSTAKAGTKLTVPVGIQGPAAKKGAVKSLTVKVSYDAGRTWKSTTVHTGKDGKRYLTLTHPAKPTTIGLKATLVDRDGNTVTETLPTAYRTVRRPDLHARTQRTGGLCCRGTVHVRSSRTA